MVPFFIPARDMRSTNSRSMLVVADVEIERALTGIVRRRVRGGLGLGRTRRYAVALYRETLTAGIGSEAIVRSS